MTSIGHKYQTSKVRWSGGDSFPFFLDIWLFAELSSVCSCVTHLSAVIGPCSIYLNWMNKYIRQGCQEEREWNSLGWVISQHCKSESRQKCTNQNTNWRWEAAQACQVHRHPGPVALRMGVLWIRGFHKSQESQKQNSYKSGHWIHTWLKAPKMKTLANIWVGLESSISSTLPFNPH